MAASRDDDPSAVTPDGNVHVVTSATPAERRRSAIPKSISWLLVILILVTVNLWYSSKDLLPMISSFTGDNDDKKSSSVVRGGRTNFTEHRAPTVHSTQMQTNVTHEKISTSRNHSLSSTKFNKTDNNIKAGPARRCNFCQEDNRIFNPSIRVQGGLTCGAIQLQTSTEAVHETICEAYQSIQTLCCPTANWTHFWGKHNPECFHLTNICHAPNDGEWFYDRSIIVPQSSNATTIRHPTIKYDQTSMHPAVYPDDNIHFNVSSTTMYSGGNNMTEECPYSHTPHHI
eukprot:scaffold571_cov76-Skeletonema_menzelii.AAC.10